VAHVIRGTRNAQETSQRLLLLHNAPTHSAEHSVCTPTGNVAHAALPVQAVAAKLVVERLIMTPLNAKHHPAPIAAMLSSRLASCGWRGPSGASSCCCAQPFAAAVMTLRSWGVAGTVPVWSNNTILNTIRLNCAGAKPEPEG
jgi:hypothetical protein